MPGRGATARCTGAPPPTKGKLTIDVNRRFTQTGILGVPALRSTNAAQISRAAQTAVDCIEASSFSRPRPRMV
jgi:hypothetical protein